jgi:hypothetical protein
MSHASIIASSEFFSAASPAVIDAIAASAQEKSLVRGDVLFKEGDAPDALYIVLTGRIAIAIDMYIVIASDIGIVIVTDIAFVSVSAIAIVIVTGSFSDSSSVIIILMVSVSAITIVIGIAT